MRIVAKVLFVSSFVSLVSVIACSPHVEKGESTCHSAKCRGVSATPAALDASSPATPYQAVPSTQPPPPLAPADAGRDAAPIRTPSGNKPQVPPPNYACRDLTRCCAKIQSGIEKAACTAVAIAAKPSVCATALIGYQIVGCGHIPFSFGTNDDDGDGTPDWVDPDGDPDTTIEDYCATPEYASDEVCTGGGTSSSYDTDPCVTNYNNYECMDDPLGTPGTGSDWGYDPSYDPYSDPGYDPYGGDPGYGGDPYAGDPYGGGYDPSGDSSGDDGSGDGFFDP